MPKIKQRNHKPKMVDAGALAKERVMLLAAELAEEYAADTGTRRGQWAYAAARMGLNPGTLSALRCKAYPRIGLALVSRVSRSVGCPIGALTDPDE